MSIKRDAAPLILTAAFVLLILALNQWIFTQPVIEQGDLAANSLLVQQAKHFTLMTGNYSRWGFHHPGPAYFYLFALGEFLFRDLLHVAASPYNAQVMTFMVFNGILLYLALHIFRRYVPLSAPVALLIVAVVAVMVNLTPWAGGPPLVMIFNWMPCALLFPYLLFGVSAASVLAGTTRDLPCMAFAGMLLIHAHFAQFLFVGVIGGGTLAVILMRARREAGLPAYLRERQRDFAIAAAIIFVFALPPLLELALDRPNNLDALLAYHHKYGWEQNSIGAAISYLVCLALFTDPMIALPKGPVGILSTGFAQARVVAYWAVFVLMFIFAMTRLRKAAQQGRIPFLGYLTWVAGISCLLSLFWATRITGGYYAFNGGFVYAIHILVWFLVLAQIERTLSARTDGWLGAVAGVLALVLMVAERKVLILAPSPDLDIRRAAEAAPTQPFGKLALIFPSHEWGWSVGVANSMKRLGKPFCVSPEWQFMFSRGSACPDLLAADSMILTAAVQACAPPCRLLFRDPSFSVAYYPHHAWTLPLTIGLHDVPGMLMLGFHATEPGQRWLSRHAAILFRLAEGQAAPPCYQLELTGFDFPGRPMQLGINGLPLATIGSTERKTTAYTIPPAAVHPGGTNTITMDTDKAAPVGGDLREIGFGFVKLTLRAAGPGEGCAAAPAPNR